MGFYNGLPLAPHCKCPYTDQTQIFHHTCEMKQYNRRDWYQKVMNIQIS